MRTLLFALVVAACAPKPPPLAPTEPELPPPPAAPLPAPLVTALPSMLPPGESAMPAMASLAPAAPITPLAAPIVSRAGKGGLEHAMRNCPTAVAGATVRTSNTPYGVEIAITATDLESRRRIIELSALHERMGDPDGSAMRHTGLHGGPGSFGHCPVIHDATTVTFTRMPRGVVIHLRALLPSDAPRVQALVAERLALREP